MKTNHTTPIRILILALVVAGGAVSCTTALEGDPGGNGSALSADGRGGPGRGRGGQGPAAFGEQRLAELTDDLGLSEEQVAQIRTIFEESMPDKRAARAGGDPSAHFEMRARIHERIAAVLTPEQRERFAKQPVERRLQNLTERLALDERQVEQVRAILQDAQTRMEQLHAGAADGTDRAEAFAAMHQQVRDRIAAVLTDTQRATFEDMPGAPGFGGPHGRGGPGHHGRGFGGGPGACGGGEGCPGACGGDCGGGEGCPGACGGDCGGGGEGCPGACGGANQ